MEVNTLDFNGPLDLLLHLVKESNIDIMDVNLSDITDQYLSYIDNLKSLDLNVDSEYLVMASDLTYIKSKSLLPKSDDEEDEDLEGDLKERLFIYQKFKDISEILRKLEKERGFYFSKEPMLTDEFRDDSLKISGTSLSDIRNAYLRYFERKEYNKPLNTVLSKNVYSVNKMNIRIMDRLRDVKRICFSDLIDKPSRGYVVVNFLSILDLTRKDMLYIYQDSNLSDILIERR